MSLLRGLGAGACGGRVDCALGRLPLDRTYVLATDRHHLSERCSALVAGHQLVQVGSTSTTMETPRMRGSILRSIAKRRDRSCWARAWTFLVGRRCGCDDLVPKW